MSPARFLPTFSVAFILSYAVTVYFNLAMFTYLPARHQFYWLVPAIAHARGSLPMFWYGWLVTSSIAAIAVTALHALVPGLKERSVWPPLVWAAPLFAFAVVAYALRVWFTI